MPTHGSLTKAGKVREHNRRLGMIRKFDRKEKTIPRKSYSKKYYHRIVLGRKPGQRGRNFVEAV